MNLKYIYTRLHVQNYLECKLFYQDVLGLNISLVNDAEEYAEIDVGATKITILNRARLKDIEIKAYLLNLECLNLMSLVK